MDRPSRWKLIVGSALLLLTVGADAAASETAEDLSTFVETYRCSVVALLLRIHANPSRDLSRRFLILDKADNGNDYVQCAFDDGDHTLLCEAASGFFAVPGTGPIFTPDERVALARLGFSTDGSRRNFQRFLHFPSGPDNDAIANLMLMALYEGFGARQSTVIEVTAPFATRHGILRKDRCVPIS
jgi:hypothetical protein